MKKLIVIAFSAMMLFAFTACENNPNTTVGDISSTDLNIAKSAYAAVISHLNETGVDQAESAEQEIPTRITVESNSYTVKYQLSSPTAVNITVTGEDNYVMTFSYENGDATIEVTVNDDKYTVQANSITNGVEISDTTGTDDDEEEEVLPPDEEEQVPAPDEDEEGTDVMEPVG